MKVLPIIAILSISLFAQTRSLEATKLTENIKIDGIMDDAWKNAKVHTNFIQWEPNPSTIPTKRTEFRFMYDAENVYFIIKSYDNKSNIITQSGKRDKSAFGGDWVYIAVSPLDDNNTGYAFLVNPSNVQGDARLYDDQNEDWDWDAIWYSATLVTENYWTAEFQIPLRALKFQSKDSQNWGFNMIRFMRKEQEKVFWEKIDPNYGYKISRFAKIKNLLGLKTKNAINIIPSIVATFDNDLDYDPTQTGRNFGLDISYNFDAQHSILATVKPDFAQIEADKDQINLSGFPLRLREKRPFFLKGKDLYDMPDEIFYTRRMGLPDAGIKFFGSKDNLKYGLTYVLNKMETENKTTRSSLDSFGNIKIDTVSNDILHHEHYLVGRINYNKAKKYNLGYLGALVKSDYEASGILHAVDVKYFIQENLRLTFMAATTLLDESNFAANEISRTYFYKNDADTIARETKTNSSLRVQMNYRTDTWYSNFRFQKKTKFFEQSLVGFPERNNTTEANLNVGRLFRFKDSHLRTIRININFNHLGSYDNQIQRFNYNVNAHANHQFKSIGRLNYGAGLNFNSGKFRYYDGPDSLGTQIDNFGYFSGKDNSGSNQWAYISTDFSKLFAVNINPWGGYQRGYDEFGLSIGFQIRPNNDLIINLSQSYNKIKNSKFYDYNGTYRTYSMRINYSILENLFAKAYIQYNSQANRLSNNLILTYEYERGSFIYFAYTESAILENYELKNRTFSLKWTYSMFL